MRRLAATPAFALILFCAACTGGSSSTVPSNTPIPSHTALSSASAPSITFTRTTLQIGDGRNARTIDVEVATTGAQTARGLGERDSLAADAGMIFDLHVTRVQSFWMKGMRFPLDMVWVGEDKRVVGVTSGVQPQPGAPDKQLTLYSSPSAVRYVLELNSGAAQRLGVKPGTLLVFDLP